MDSALHFYVLLTIFATVGCMFISNDIDKADDEYDDSKLVARRDDDSKLLAGRYDDSKLVARRYDDSKLVARRYDDSKLLARRYDDSKLLARRYEDSEAEDISEYEYSQDPYNFGYNLEDNFGNTQFREENKGEDGVVRGSYGYRDPYGMYRHVSYVADAGGFHAVLRTNEPGIDNRNSADVAVVAQAPLYGYPIRRQERRSSPIAEKA